MMLLLDIGNSRVKWGLTRGANLYGFGACPGNDRQRLLAELQKLHKPEAVYFISVADKEFNHWLTELLNEYWNLRPVELYPEKRCCGVLSGYRHPSKLGVDRWAALIASRQLFKGPLCVVDCGSAMTIDAMDGDGRHLGGYIMPGLAMQQRLLKQHTAAIGESGYDVAVEGWGRDTKECLSEGAMQSMVALIERSAIQHAKQMNSKVELVLTGGDAARLQPRLMMDAILEPHLVLKGLLQMVMAQEA